MVDILPRLMPRISRNALDSRIRTIREMATQEHGYVDRRHFYNTMAWLDQHRFYLSSDLCDELNDLWPAAQDKLEHQEWLLQYKRFTPNPEFDDSYFL